MAMAMAARVNWIAVRDVEMQHTAKCAQCIGTTVVQAAGDTGQFGILN